MAERITMTDAHNLFIAQVTDVIGNRKLAAGLWHSLSSALNSNGVHFIALNPWHIFEHSLDAAIRGIVDHPRGRLLQRLLVYGPTSWNDFPGFIGDGITRLSDEECGLCIGFIYSHMVNRFKGEIAELLAVEPVAELIHTLVHRRLLPRQAALLWGETVQARRRLSLKSELSRWTGWAKGPDGLVVNSWGQSSPSGEHLKIAGIVEVKSMACSWNRIAKQLQRHRDRLYGGVNIS